MSTLKLGLRKPSLGTELVRVDEPLGVPVHRVDRHPSLYSFGDEVVADDGSSGRCLALVGKRDGRVEL